MNISNINSVYISGKEINNVETSDISKYANSKLLETTIPTLSAVKNTISGFQKYTPEDFYLTNSYYGTIDNSSATDVFYGLVFTVSNDGTITTSTDESTISQSDIVLCSQFTDITTGEIRPITITEFKFKNISGLTKIRCAKGYNAAFAVNGVDSVTFTESIPLNLCNAKSVDLKYIKSGSYVKINDSLTSFTTTSPAPEDCVIEISDMEVFSGCGAFQSGFLNIAIKLIFKNITNLSNDKKTLLNAGESDIITKTSTHSTKCYPYGNNTDVSFNYTITIIDETKTSTQYINKTVMSIDVKNVTHIGDNIFCGFNMLEGFKYENVETLGEGVFKYTILTSFINTSSNTIKRIPKNCFTSTSLTTINLSNVEYIDDGAFKDCYSLEKVQGSSLRYIGEDAFKNCIELKYIDFSNVEIFKYHCFKNCILLTSPTAPATTEAVDCFKFNARNVKIEFEAFANAFTSYISSGVKYDKITMSTASGIDSTAKTEGFTDTLQTIIFDSNIANLTIDRYAFNDAFVKNIYFNCFADVNIGDYAFIKSTYGEFATSEASPSITQNLVFKDCDVKIGIQSFYNRLFNEIIFYGDGKNIEIGKHGFSISKPDYCVPSLSATLNICGSSYNNVTFGNNAFTNRCLSKVNIRTSGSTESFISNLNFGIYSFRQRVHSKTYTPLSIYIGSYVNNLIFETSAFVNRVIQDFNIGCGMTNKISFGLYSFTLEYGVVNLANIPSDYKGANITFNSTNSNADSDIVFGKRSFKNQIINKINMENITANSISFGFEAFAFDTSISITDMTKIPADIYIYGNVPTLNFGASSFKDRHLNSIVLGQSTLTFNSNTGKVDEVYTNSFNGLVNISFDSYAFCSTVTSSLPYTINDKCKGLFICGASNKIVFGYRSFDSRPMDNLYIGSSNSSTTNDFGAPINELSFEPYSLNTDESIITGNYASEFGLTSLSIGSMVKDIHFKPYSFENRFLGNKNYFGGYNSNVYFNYYSMNITDNAIKAITNTTFTDYAPEYIFCAYSNYNTTTKVYTTQSKNNNGNVTFGPYAFRNRPVKTIEFYRGIESINFFTGAFSATVSSDAQTGAITTYQLMDTDIKIGNYGGNLIFGVASFKDRSVGKLYIGSHWKDIIFRTDSFRLSYVQPYEISGTTYNDQFTTMDVQIFDQDKLATFESKKDDQGIEIPETEYDTLTKLTIISKQAPVYCELIKFCSFSFANRKINHILIGSHVDDIKFSYKACSYSDYGKNFVNTSTDTEETKAQKNELRTTLRTNAPTFYLVIGDDIGTVTFTLYSMYASILKYFNILSDSIGYTSKYYDGYTLSSKINISAYSFNMCDKLVTCPVSLETDYIGTSSFAYDKLLEFDHLRFNLKENATPVPTPETGYSIIDSFYFIDSDGKKYCVYYMNVDFSVLYAKTIGSYAFNNCKKIKKVESNTITLVRDNAFVDCDLLTEISLQVCCIVEAKGFHKSSIPSNTSTYFIKLANLPSVIDLGEDALSVKYNSSYTGCISRLVIGKCENFGDNCVNGLWTKMNTDGYLTLNGQIRKLGKSAFKNTNSSYGLYITINGRMNSAVVDSSLSATEQPFYGHLLISYTSPIMTTDGTKSTPIGSDSNHMKNCKKYGAAKAYYNIAKATEITV